MTKSSDPHGKGLHHALMLTTGPADAEILHSHAKNPRPEVSSYHRNVTSDENDRGSFKTCACKLKSSDQASDEDAREDL